MKTSRLITITATLLGGMIAGAQAQTGEWNAADGKLGGLTDWSNTGNWVGGIVPNGIDAEAQFFSEDFTAANEKPVLDGAVTLGIINATRDVTIDTGAGALTLESSSGPAEILAGNGDIVDINEDVTLNSNLNITLTGSGRVQFDGLLTGATDISVTGPGGFQKDGGLSFLGDPSGFTGNITLDGTVLRTKDLQPADLANATLTIESGVVIYNNRDDSDSEIAADILLNADTEIRNDGNRGGGVFSGAISGVGGLTLDTGNGNRIIEFKGAAPNTFLGDVLIRPNFNPDNTQTPVKLSKDGAFGGTSSIDVWGTEDLQISEDSAGDGVEDRISDSAALTLYGGTEIARISNLNDGGDGDIKIKYHNARTALFDPALGAAEIELRMETDLLQVQDVTVTEVSAGVFEIAFIESSNSTSGPWLPEQNAATMTAEDGTFDYELVVPGGYARCNLQGATVNETVDTLFIGNALTQQPAGTYGHTDSGADNGGQGVGALDAYFLGDGVLTVLNGPSVVGDPYDTWIADPTTGYFPGETDVEIIGKDKDPDGDGKDNNYEFGFNGDPSDASDNGMIAGFVQDTGGAATKELTLIVAVRNDAVFVSIGTPPNVVQKATQDGVSYTIEGSEDLVGIPDSDVSYASGPDNTAPAGSGLTVDLTSADWKYHTFKLDASEGLPDVGFLRAKAE